MSQTETPATDMSIDQEQLHLSWQYPQGLISLSFTNILLRISTFGIYHFWAKTEVRKKIWTGVRINNEPLTYTGRGIELFLGFLIVFLAIFLPLILLVIWLQVSLGPQNHTSLFISYISYMIFFFLVGIAIYRAQRYRLARTKWRGIRGSLQGRPVRYAWTYFWTLLLIPFTLGWIIPWRTTKLQGIITNNTRFGDRPLSFNAKSGALYGPFTFLWLGAALIYFAMSGLYGFWLMSKIQTAQLEGQIGANPSREDIVLILVQAVYNDIGLILAAIIPAVFLYSILSSWYSAQTTNHFAAHTHFENATFNGNLTAIGLTWIKFSNFLILLAGAILISGLIFGIAFPFIDSSMIRVPEGQAFRQVLLPVALFAIILAFSLFTPITQARTAGYIVRNLKITGTAPLDKITQSSHENNYESEGLAEAFDIDIF